jgi:hypothetical protein
MRNEWEGRIPKQFSTLIARNGKLIRFVFWCEGYETNIELEGLFPSYFHVLSTKILDGFRRNLELSSLHFKIFYESKFGPYRINIKSTLHEAQKECCKVHTTFFVARQIIIQYKTDIYLYVFIMMRFVNVYVSSSSFSSSSSSIPVAPALSTRHPWKISFHFNFLIWDSRGTGN